MYSMDSNFIVLSKLLMNYQKFVITEEDLNFVHNNHSYKNLIKIPNVLSQ